MMAQVLQSLETVPNVINVINSETGSEQSKYSDSDPTGEKEGQQIS